MNDQVPPTPGSAQLRINPAVPYILYGAFVFACFVYGGLIASGLLDAAVSPLELPVPLFLIFGALALSHIPLALVMGRTVPLERETDALALFRAIIRKLIFQCAFFEAIAIYGLVGYILGMDSMIALIFVGFGLLCLVALIPGLQSQMDRLRTVMRDGQASQAESR